jgi:hypothetical protein
MIRFQISSSMRLRALCASWRTAFGSFESLALDMRFVKSIAFWTSGDSDVSLVASYAGSFM